MCAYTLIECTSINIYVIGQGAIKVDKYKFLAVASCSRKEFQNIVDLMMEYNPSDNGKDDNIVML